MKPYVFAAVFGLSAVTSALALPPLSEVKHITQGLRDVAIADEIRKKCDSISPRMFRALSFIKSLEKHAVKLGYSDAQIEAYVDDKAEKKRLIAQARKYMAQQGVRTGESATYCALGRAEIARNSQVGYLLKAK